MTLLLFGWFLVSLQRGAYRYQFNRFGFVVVGSSLIGLSISCFMGLQTFGRVWSFFVLTVISVNDAAAYFVGSAIGRTPLIKLSPNKTLEGYLGGAIITVILTALMA